MYGVGAFVLELDIFGFMFFFCLLFVVWFWVIDLIFLILVILFKRFRFVVFKGNSVC